VLDKESKFIWLNTLEARKTRGMALASALILGRLLVASGHQGPLEVSAERQSMKGSPALKVTDPVL
jgi:hypothetical protein